MPTWSDLLTEVMTLTKRPDMIVQSEIALRQSVRNAHKSGKYWRDLVEVTLTALDLDQVQSIDIATNLPKFRQMVYIKSTEQEDKYFNPVLVDDLLDNDGYARTNVYWGFGSAIKIRAYSPESSYKFGYWKYPTVPMGTSTTFDSWIAEEHSDLLTLWAAVTVLNQVGENEIRDKLQQLAIIALADLQQDNLETVGR